MKYYVYAEDLASALIGPFDSTEEATAHVRFCVERGDGAYHEVLTDAEAADYDDVDTKLTPQQDRDYKVPE